MTALPDEPQHDFAVPYDQRRYYTAEEFADLPEDNSALYELQEGKIVVSPKATVTHMNVIIELAFQLKPQLPRNLVVLPEIDVDLQLSPPSVRMPDLAVISSNVFGKKGITKAPDVLVAVEVLSPRSGKIDMLVKPLEYAEAGIPHYWLIDPKPPVTATVYRLIDGHYEESQRAEHILIVDEPCPLRVDLDALLPNLP